MGHMSNRERIARAAEEARLAAADKAAKAAKAVVKKSPKRAAKTARVKIVWAVCNGNGKVLETFSYPDRDAAEAATEALIRSTGSTHILRPTKVPMD